MSPSRNDQLLRILLSASSVFAALIVVGIVGYLFREMSPLFSGGKWTSLFADSSWQPGSARDPQFGIFPMLVGTFLVAVLAILIAAPLGIVGAVHLEFFAPRIVARWQHRMLELLAGIPSVVFGFWGLSVLVPLINKIQPPGQSLLAAGMVLALMILPTVGITTRAALRAVDPSLWKGSMALGMDKSAAIVQVVLPAARRGISGGCILALTRAIGETMAVVMVCGNIAQIPQSLLEPIRPITSSLALEMGYATAQHKAFLYATALILVLTTASLLTWQFVRRRGTALH